MEESADQAHPPMPDCEQSKEVESKSEEATGLLDGDEEKGDNKFADLNLTLDWGAGVGAELVWAKVTAWHGNSTGMLHLLELHVQVCVAAFIGFMQWLAKDFFYTAVPCSSQLMSKMKWMFSQVDR